MQPLMDILTQRMVNKSWHSPLAALTSCLNKLGGDMMCPVVRAEKAAEAEGSAPYRQEVCPVVTLRHPLQLSCDEVSFSSSSGLEAGHE
jgi:hypothetical protein